mgnify:CR=1 FL=1
MITIKSERELELMRKAGRIVMMAHYRIRELVAPGVTTRELDGNEQDHKKANQRFHKHDNITPALLPNVTLHALRKPRMARFLKTCARLGWTLPSSYR